jgi:RimJ/RimL family protein N-acetyltransferase
VIDSDLPTFFEQQCDPEANQMAAFPARDRDAFQAHWTKILADPAKSVRTILLGDQVAGNIGSWEQEGQRLVGYWIGKTYWGKGVATAALSQFLDLVEARPLHAHVAKHNIASIRVLQKCGFSVCVEETASGDRPRDGVEELVFKLDGRTLQIPATTVTPAADRGRSTTEAP